MVKGYEPRSLLEFQKEFPDAEACYAHLVRKRWAEGWKCPACGHDQSWFLAKRRLFDCKACRRQTSVTAGTIFHKSRVSLMKWYWLIYHMATEKVGVSVAQMQRMLDIRDYRTAWLMAHKVRKGMKAVIRGAHPGVSDKHLQAYLSEICYRFNRRYWERELFDRLVKACLSTQTVTYKDLVA